MKGAIKFLLVIAVLLAIVVGILRAFFVREVIVAHDGMAPTMLAGETVLMWNGTGSDLEMGDIALCRNPANLNETVFGRVIGRTGMAIQTMRGQLQVANSIVDIDITGHERFTNINGETDEYRFATEKLGNTDYNTMQPKDRALEIRPFTVSRGVYLLGDNRNQTTSDSREYGPVDPNTCIGTLFMRLKPAEGRDFFDHGWLDILDP